ncbi:glycoside hydrolase family 97 N-terminal domain-containing protein [Nonomuraea sp. 3N208]|uniref:glycoside hydrolase family 97 N-terminal domain-containing protein n=1 Tax=Nonomuraea sp. 3N208 TaxID=3457421 RepID=UPI003FD04852
MPTATPLRLCAALLLSLCLLPASPARAAEQSWRISGFPGGPAAELALDPEAGALTLTAERGGVRVLEPSPVGLVTERADLSQGLRFLHRRDRVVAEHYTTTVGKRLKRSALMREATFAFANAAGARLDLIVRAARDGVAYRYRWPDDHGPVLRETSAFTLRQDAAAWLARHRRDYENPFVQYTALSAPAADFMVPALFETGGGHLLITESALDGGYSGPRLTHEEDTGTYRLGLWDQQVQAPGETPWRVLVIGDLATVTESTLVDDLAPDSRVRDASWIRPGQVLWTWLAGGREAGQSLEIQKGYVDYASRRGWPYVAVDAGWYFLPYQWNGI